MSLVTINDLILPRELSEFEKVLAPRLLKEAEMIVRAEFGRVHKNFPTETDEWEIFTVKRVIKEMVTSAILVGASRGMRSVSSTTGPQADSVVWADVESVALGGLVLTDSQRELLGLLGSSRFNFPLPGRWPEVSDERDCRDYF
ncbi:Gp19/Gp15/Gp42 family protein [Corynebacterium diphtheriae]|uniref:Gp19/Gp15/Gp42 family protein n=1 Tax=Corynebacterium diphtheriae TaxID=1717 RepID=UPI00403D58BB